MSHNADWRIRSPNSSCSVTFPCESGTALAATSSSFEPRPRVEVGGSPVTVAPILAHTDVVEESSRGSTTAVDPVAQRQSSNTGSTPARRVQLEKVTAATSVAVSASAIAAVAQQTGCFPCCYSGGGNSSLRSRTLLMQAYPSTRLFTTTSLVRTTTRSTIGQRLRVASSSRHLCADHGYSHSL